jgi:thymidine kinase
MELRAHDGEPLRVGIIGPMFSGKSNRLQEIGRQHKIAGYTVLCFHHPMHSRDPDGVIRTHNGVTFQSKAMDGDQITRVPKLGGAESKRWVVLIEEAQFYDDLERVLDYFEKLNVDVYFSALNMKYNGQPFESIRDTIHTCTHVKHHYSVCVRCSSTRARYSHRLTKQTEDVVVGGADVYEALCKPCFTKARNGETTQ